MIFVDSNIPMYLVGVPHPNKAIAQKIVERLLNDQKSLVTSAEVFQEILHRFTAIQRPEFIDVAFAILKEMVDEIFSILPDDVFRAKEILPSLKSLSARDCLHIATMRRNEILEIFSFDKGFDQVPGIHRYPM